MKTTSTKFVHYYPMPNGLTVRIAIVTCENSEKDILLIQYGPKTATQEQFFALRATPEFEDAITHFYDIYGEFLKQSHPDGLAGVSV